MDEFAEDYPGTVQWLVLKCARHDCFKGQPLFYDMSKSAGQPTFIPFNRPALTGREMDIWHRLSRRDRFPATAISRVSVMHGWNAFWVFLVRF